MKSTGQSLKPTLTSKYLQAFKKAELTGKYLSMSDSTHLRNLECQYLNISPSILKMTGSL